MSLAAAKPQLAQGLEYATDSAGGLGDIERHFAAYLDAEKQLGRIGPDADTETLAFTLLGTVHHLILTSRGDKPDLPGHVHRIVAALVTGMGASDGQAPAARAGS